MPRIAAALSVLGTVAICIGFNTMRYPLVREMVSGVNHLSQPEKTNPSEPIPDESPPSQPSPSWQSPRSLPTDLVQDDSLRSDSADGGSAGWQPDYSGYSSRLAMRRSSDAPAPPEQSAEEAPEPWDEMSEEGMDWRVSTPGEQAGAPGDPSDAADPMASPESRPAAATPWGRYASSRDDRQVSDHSPWASPEEPESRKDARDAPPMVPLAARQLPEKLSEPKPAERTWEASPSEGESPSESAPGAVSGLGHSVDRGWREAGETFDHGDGDVGGSSPSVARGRTPSSDEFRRLPAVEAVEMAPSALGASMGPDGRVPFYPSTNAD